MGEKGKGGVRHQDNQLFSLHIFQVNLSKGVAYVSLSTGKGLLGFKTYLFCCSLPGERERGAKGANMIKLIGRVDAHYEVKDLEKGKV